MEYPFQAPCSITSANRTGRITGYLVVSPHPPQAIKRGEPTVDGTRPAKILDRLQRLKAANHAHQRSDHTAFGAAHALIPAFNRRIQAGVTGRCRITEVIDRQLS